MPNRIIKESICSSDSIDGLNWFEEVFFYRLMVNVDDYGRLDARPAMLRARLFPLKTNITDKMIEATLNRLASTELVSTYMVEDKPYLHLPSWEKHQSIRNIKSKYPAPDERECAELKSIEISCNQLNANVPVIQSNPIRNPNPNPNPIRIGVDAPPPTEHKYGMYSNVLLTDDDLLKLKAEFPDWADRVDNLSEGIETKGYKYKNHLATIRAWARKDSESGQQPNKPTGAVSKFAYLDSSI